MPKYRYRRLREEDRRVIHRMSKEGISQSSIATAIGFSQPTVSRELSRNRGLRGYRPGQAEAMARRRQAAKPARRPALDLASEMEVVSLLAAKLSPEQIAGSTGLCSRQTIYRLIYADKAAGGELHRHLRINGRRRYRRRSKAARSRIPGRIDISRRPASVGARRAYGHWEADLMEGAGRSGYLVSLLERKSRIALLAKLPGKSSAEVAAAIARMLAGSKVLSITYDNGLEFALHEQVSRELGCRSYFCAPYSSWEKGSVENYNGLVRQYIPKKSRLDAYDDDAIRRIQDQINNRPRKLHGYRAPIHYKNKIAA
jgi:IS30 family transposase